MKYPKTRYTGEHPWTNKDWLYNEYITKDRASIEIANEYGCSQATIQSYLLKFGIKKVISRHLISHDKPYQKFEYLYKRHIVDHISMAQIARENSVSQDTIRYNLNRLCIESWTVNERKTLTKTDIERIIELYVSGLSCKRIGELFGVRHKRISTLLRKHGIRVRSISEMNLMINKSYISNVSLFNDYDFMHDLYWNKNLTMYEIAEYFGNIHYSVIRRQLIYLGINLKSNPRNMVKNDSLNILKRSLRSYLNDNQLRRVLSRDNYKCQKCGRSFPEVYLNMHHFIPFSKIVSDVIRSHKELDINITEDRLKMFYYIINDPNFQDDNNVITYCIECHKDAHRSII